MWIMTRALINTKRTNYCYDKFVKWKTKTAKRKVSLLGEERDMRELEGIWEGAGFSNIQEIIHSLHRSLLLILHTPWARIENLVFINKSSLFLRIWDEFYHIFKLVYPSLPSPVKHYVCFIVYSFTLHLSVFVSLHLYWSSGGKWLYASVSFIEYNCKMYFSVN